MQEIHSIGGGGGGGSRFFGGGDRRLRPNHQNNQALKCPRCDSINTKFCYYNNYNLSQPRHFCKNCRRYWTKGGVLRNVPVGGGCRKSKRSSKPRNTNTSSSSETTALPQLDTEHNSNNSHSSSESSSLTAAATEAGSASALNSESNSNLQEAKSLNIHVNPPNPVLVTGALEQAGTGDCGGGIFSEIGNFSSLIASSSATTTNEALAFGFGNGIITPDASSFQWQHQNHQGGEQELKMQGNHLGGALLDHQSVDLSTAALQSKAGGGFGSLDWHSGGADHQGLFDLPNTVDQAYWNHTPHWSDHDNSTLFHLP